ncbi:dihydrofolate reductase family protein [Pseudonocardia sp. GCM10023141]|uniref:dihydrofolate reductase family protein n=1 Tax=Pseudonocardia sp. GCM10023141 TaxID=3252653 RepID=UPI003618BAFC
MRKLIVQELISVDGCVADEKDGLDFFEVVADYSESDRDSLAMMAGVDTILLGSVTYGIFADFWPTAAGEPMGEVINTTARTVFSASLDAAPWGRFAPAQLVAGDAATHVRALKQAPGSDIVVWGSISLAQYLFAAGLVDELRLTVVPTLVGPGRRLGFDRDRTLRLTDTKRYASGLVGLRYAIG